MSTGMLIGTLAAGGLLLLVACAGCGGLGIFGYFLATRSPILGAWEQTDANPFGLKQQITFDSDGKAAIKLPNIQVNFKYRFKDNVLELEPAEPIAAGPFGNLGNQVQRFNVTFRNDEMTWTRIGAQPFGGGPAQQHFRRVK